MRAPAAAWQLVAVLLMLTVSGCGFHLRSYDVGSNIASAHVAADPRNPLETPLKLALRQAGVAEADNPADAAVVVTLLDSRRQRRNVTVSSQARVAEYETVLAVRYQVTDAQGNELVPAQWVERERVFRVNPENIVGNSEEQALLEREMQNDLVQQILRTLNAVAERRADAG